MDGITAAREIKAQHPHVKIIGLSEYAEGYQAHAMELAGAAGTYLKSAATEKLYRSSRESRLRVQRHTHVCTLEDLIVSGRSIHGPLYRFRHLYIG